MDIGKSIGFVFEDKDWAPKVLLGGIIGLIPIVNLAVEGYSLRTLRNVAEGKEQPLPEWNDFGDYFMKGLLIAVAGLIYAAPAIVLSVFTTLLGQAVDQSSARDAAQAVALMLGCLQAFYSLLLGIWLPATIMNYAATQDFAAFFRFGEIWNLISRNPGDYILALVMTVVVGIVAGLVGFVLCIVGLLFTTFIAQVIYAHLFGQVLRESGRAVTPQPPSVA